ncbi:MAG: hypothetical protein JST17_03605 [Bacteroidetes bacterium]|nr:hypothetical protein [Bacteroidota bacterium]MBS1929495.1 hypothetical protein [Bacteroidota bacterium]
MKIKFLFLAALLATGFLAFSQDKIYRKNGKVVEAKVIEIDPDEIKYKEFNNPDGPVYVLETDRINKIVYANGKTERFELNFKDPEKYIGQRNRAIKIDFLGPLFGYSQFSYEKSLGVGKSYELSLGIIGAGKSWHLDYYDSQFGEVKKNQFGFFAGAGYKFGKLPDFLLFGKTRLTHLMQGTYIKPMVYLGNYSENMIAWKGNNNYSVEKQNVTFGALQIEFGRQWVFNDKFTLDIYEGFGYGFDNKKQNYSNFNLSPDDNLTAYNYANARLGRSPGFSYTFSLKFGMLLKNRESNR